MNLLQTIEQEEVSRVTKDKTIPEFSPGDTIRVNVRIIEGNTERVQAFEGVCIGRKNAGVNSNVTVRKLSHGEGVERIFPLFSPRLDSIELIRRGAVRRAKLYYLRGLTGKAARIAEKRDYRAEEERAEQKAANAAANAARTAKAQKEDSDKKQAKAKAKPGATGKEKATTKKS